MQTRVVALSQVEKLLSRLRVTSFQWYDFLRILTISAFHVSLEIASLFVILPLHQSDNPYVLTLQ
jgi:hypothetical protein